MKQEFSQNKFNNFDLLRLFAALHVLVGHGIEYLKLSPLFLTNKFLRFFWEIFSLFPGVLVFFTISGFLIFSSYERSKSLKKYFLNRFLRIFPALWVCFAITIGLLLSFNVVGFSDLFKIPMLVWSACQLTFFQGWTPGVLKSWGMGSVNSSLWTTPTEIQFYLLLPISALLLPRVKLVHKFFVMALFSAAIAVTMSHFKALGAEKMFAFKLIHLTVLPYLYCFLAGSMMSLYWNSVRRFLEGKAWLWLVLFGLYCFSVGDKPLYFPNATQLVANILISILTISMAYTLPQLGKVLHGNDISYGMYIYNMLVINSFVELGLVGDIKYLAEAILATMLLGYLSWVLVEKNALSLKNNPAFSAAAPKS